MSKIKSEIEPNKKAASVTLASLRKNIPMPEDYSDKSHYTCALEHHLGEILNCLDILER